MEEEILDSYIKAGRIAAEALQHGKGLIKPGVTVLAVCDAVEAKIIALGGSIAFPAQVSLNAVAAHYCPTEDDATVFKAGDLAKLDIGVHINGYIADTALTVDLGDHAEMVRAAEDALDAALAKIALKAPLGEVGKAIQEKISSYGFSPIRNLSGHGLGKFMVHSHPTIPNFDTGDRATLPDNAAFACEPFSTNGRGSIFESSHATVFSLVQARPVRSPYAREILKHLEEYEGLPFTTRWLTRKFGKGKALMGLKELIANGSVHEYPPLPEVAGGLVAQCEHSFLFHDGKKIVYTRIEG